MLSAKTERENAFSLSLHLSPRIRFNLFMSIAPDMHNIASGAKNLKSPSIMFSDSIDSLSIMHLDDASTL
jgi:hypothetical protein